jgi:hypothetical protein
MHRYAEYGKASHWLYKSEESGELDDWYALAERTRRLLPRELGRSINLPSNGGKLPSADGAAAASSSSLPGAAVVAGARRLAGEGGGRMEARVAGRPARSPRQYDGSAAGFSLLENLRVTLRERRVYALVRDSRQGGPQVLALQAGARLEDALKELRARRGPAAATATVNGRQVRLDYRIRHGDLLTLVPRAALNSAAWLEGGGAGREEGEGSEEGGGVPVPVPWPWSLIDEGCEWYAEAEVKHGAVAILALGNWLLLCLLGETSLGAEPLESVGTPLGAIAWGSQFGAVALLEASVMHVSTSHAIARLRIDGAGSIDRLGIDGAGAADDAVARLGLDGARSTDGIDGAGTNDRLGIYSAGATARRGIDGARTTGDIDGAGAKDDWRSLPRWLRFLPPADHPTSIAVAKLSQRVRPFSLWLGRAAMVGIASLALRADVSSAPGILHSIIVERPHSAPVAELLRGVREGQGEPKAARAAQVLPEAQRSQRPLERAASFYDDIGIAPISLDVILQDVWPDDARS